MARMQLCEHCQKSAGVTIHYRGSHRTSREQDTTERHGTSPPYFWLMYAAGSTPTRNSLLFSRSASSVSHHK